MGTQNNRFGTVRDLNDAESHRQQLQSLIESQKSLEERRRLGQFATPLELAKEIASYGLRLQTSSGISFLEPAIGTGAFYSALLSELPKSGKNLDHAIGIEVDGAFVHGAEAVWGNSISLRHQDFTTTHCQDKVNFLLSNPPYVRHHYIDQERKAQLNKTVQDETGIKLSGLAGLYCYFILLAHKWLAPKAVSGWLIPSEFMDVNYGTAVKTYLLDHVRLLRIHRYEPEDLKFNDALVTSCVVWFSNETCDEDYTVEFTYGGSLERPRASKLIHRSVLEASGKWTRLIGKPQGLIEKKEHTLGDFFTVKRGLATGDNDFFILDKARIDALGLDMKFFTPILPSPRYLKVNEIFRDENGDPILEGPKYLLNCPLSEAETEKLYPKLWSYLQSGKNTAGSKYLCRNRKTWYMQEHREPTPFLCSYMGRGSGQGVPFRFILNHSDALATNSYLLLYPRQDLQKAMEKDPQLVHEVWKALQQITADDLENEGRVYGGGLKKIEPKELAKVRFNQIANLIDSR